MENTHCIVLPPLASVVETRIAVVVVVVVVVLAAAAAAAIIA